MTTIDNATKERLEWLQEQLTRMWDNGWVRLDGETVFRSARQELDDIVGTATPPQAVAPVLAVMKVDQVEALVDATVARVEAIRVDLEGGELAVLDAIAQTRADVLGAMPKAEEPAPAAA